MAAEKPKDSRWWWPSIKDESSARRAARQGMWVALFMSAVTAGFATFKLFGFGPGEFVDVVFILFLAVGLSRYSRLAAIGGMGYYLVSRVVLYVTAPNLPRNPVMAVLFTLVFVNALRGTWFYHRLIGSRVNWKHVMVLSGVAATLTIVVAVVELLAISSFFDEDTFETIFGGTLFLMPLITFAVLPLVSPLRTTRPAEKALPAPPAP